MKGGKKMNGVRLILLMVVSPLFGIIIGLLFYIRLEKAIKTRNKKAIELWKKKTGIRIITPEGEEITPLKIDGEDKKYADYGIPIGRNIIEIKTDDYTSYWLPFISEKGELSPDYPEKGIPQCMVRWKKPAHEEV